MSLMVICESFPKLMKVQSIFFLVFLLLQGEHVVVEELLQLLVRKVNAKLNENEVSL
jgi:hypothetical protein